MPPLLVLLLCIIFILILYIIDHKKNSYNSRALWIPLIWLMIISSRSVSMWFQINAVTEASTEIYLEGNPFDRKIFILLIIVGLLIILKRKIRWNDLLKNNPWLFLFILYCGVSILWSEFPFVSFKRYIRELGSFIMVLIILTEAYPVEAIKTVIKRCFFVLVPLSVVLIKYYSHLGRIYHRYSGELMVTGVTTNKNGLGILCTVCCLALFWMMFTLWINNKISSDKKSFLSQLSIFAISLWLLIIANSMTSLSCFIVGISTLFVIRTPIIKNHINYFGSFIILTLCCILFLQYSIDLIPTLLEMVGRDITFTGRTLLWSDLINLVKNPLVGTGFNSFWLGSRMETLWAEYWWKPTGSHNGYLEIFLNLGLIGVFLFIGVIFSTYLHAKRKLLTNFEYGIFRMLFLIVVVLYNIAEATFMLSNLIWFVFLLISIDYPEPTKNHLAT